MRTLFQKSLFLVCHCICLVVITKAEKTASFGSMGTFQLDTIPNASPTLISIDESDCSMAYHLEYEYDFVPVLKCQFQHPGIVTYALPLFADIDGDEQTEVVATLEHSPDGFAIINPTNCEVEFIVDVGGDIKLKDGGPVLGDVDHNGRADIFIEVDTKIQRWEYNPDSDEIVKIWETPGGVSTADRSHLDILDLNQDGTPELIPNRGKMVNSITGYVYPGTLPVLNTEAKGLFAFTADADPGEAPAGQGNVELIYGTHMYRYDFQNEEWIMVRNVPAVDWGENANVSVADMDLDGDVDAVISRWNSTGEALIWDLQTNELLGGGIFDYPGQYGSRINIANMDEDDYPEMVMTCVFKVFVIDDIVSTGGFGHVIWLDVTSDESGHTQITSFDFDGNGTYEIAYRDETRLRIFSGMGTGEPEGDYPSSPRVLMDTGDANACESYTGMEYPTIGDIDNDNQAEIIASCRTSISIYESGSLPWGNASKVWNTQAFNVTCVEQDGTIPAVPVENYKIYNNFLAQVNTNPESDTLFVAVPDAYIELTNVQNDCEGGISVDIEVCNQGAAALPENTPVALYWRNPTAVEATLIDTFRIAISLEVGQCYTIESDYFTVSASIVELFAVVNDDGMSALPYVLDAVQNGGSFPITSIDECSYINNMADKTISIASNASYEIGREICEGESWEVDGQVFTEAGIYTYTLTAGNGCDSTIVLQLEVLTHAETNLVATICEGTTYLFGEEHYDQPGVYQNTLQAINGCDSIVNLDLSVLLPTTATLEAAICEGESYTLANQTYTQSGTYQNTFTASNGCDSVVTLNLEVWPQELTTLTATICEGEGYSLGSTNYETTGTYTEVFQNENGCDSTVTLELAVLSPIETSMQVAICQGEAFQLGATTYAQAGTYQETFNASNSCDSIVTVELTILEPVYETLEVEICEGGSYAFGANTVGTAGVYENTLTAENGCDSIVSLTLNVITPSVYSFNTSICAGEAYTLNGSDYEEAGTYLQTLTAANGCDSLIQFEVAVLPRVETSFITTICEGESYSFGGSALEDPGIYSATLTAENGCDSTATLELQVQPKIRTFLHETICFDGDFQIGDQHFAQSGTYQERFIAENGCDSIVTLSLTVLPSINTLIAKSICQGESVLFAGNSVNSTGVYVHTYQSAMGCDSVVSLNLEVMSPSSTHFSATLCAGESYDWNGTAYQNTGDYQKTYPASNGCDSTVYFHLEVLPIPQTYLNKTVCKGEEVLVGGNFYNTSGIYNEILKAENGCDSLVELALTVIPPLETNLSATICPDERYEFNGLMYNQSGSYTATYTATSGCDSTVYLQLNVLPLHPGSVQEYVICEGDSILANGVYYNSPGTHTQTFQNSNGCDSLVTIHVEMLPLLEIYGADASICEGESVQLEVFGATTYKWSPAVGLSCTDCPNPIASPSQTTVYSVFTTGCMDAVIGTSIVVEVYEQPEVDAGEDKQLVFGESIVLEAQTSDDDLWMSWETPQGVLCEDCPSRIKETPTESTTYRVTVVNEWGCVATDDLTVDLRTACVDSDFFIPNIISPNDDGSNDFFYIEPAIDANMRFLRIYDRWGELIFATADFHEKWDGTFRGQSLNPGVYVYYLDVECPDGEPYHKVGNVTILK